MLWTTLASVKRKTSQNIMEEHPLNQQVPPEQWVRHGYNSPTDTTSAKSKEQGVMIIIQMKMWMPWHECRTGILDNAASGCVGLTQARSFWASKAGRSRSLDDIPRAGHQSILTRLWIFNFPRRSWNSQPNNRMEEFAPLAANRWAFPSALARNPTNLGVHPKVRGVIKTGRHSSLVFTPIVSRQRFCVSVSVFE